MTKNAFRLLRHGDFVSYELKPYIYMESEGSLLHMRDGDGNKVIADYTLVRLDSFYDRNIIQKYTRYIFEFFIFEYLLYVLYFSITEHFLHTTLFSWKFFANFVLGVIFVFILRRYDSDREIFT